MKIIVDENISFGMEAFSQFGEVELVHGRKITNDLLKDADALITRSITKVNKDLLQGTAVRFTGTATIGMDHFDLEYLKSQNIKYANAAGCNSQAVTEYVLSALVHLGIENDFTFENKTIGIIGVGNIGKKIEKLANELGMKVLLNDPPREREEGKKNFVDLDEALSADIITLHVPLNKGGDDNTIHLINEENIDLINEGAVLINACRGPVVDNRVLFERIVNYRDLITVLDVWENEPNLSLDLLEVVDIATPHIAGYTLEGKVNGTSMIYNSLAEFLGETPTWKPPMPEVENNIIKLEKNLSVFEKWFNVMNYVYPIFGDSSALKKAVEFQKLEVGAYFDSLRKDYKLRRELSNYEFQI